MQHPEGVPDDSDLDSNAPLLPTTARTDEERKDPSHARYRFAWAWAVLGTFAIGLLWLAFGQAYLDRREDEARKGDPGFPSRIGFEGPTPTGGEAFAAATSYPHNFDSSPLNPPPSLATEEFNLLHYLGNLSPWRTVNHGLKSTAQVPDGCVVEQASRIRRTELCPSSTSCGGTRQAVESDRRSRPRQTFASGAVCGILGKLHPVQLLHRHGARYPTSGAGTESFAKNVVGVEGFKASGNLTFLNDWKYRLGAEILTPFGREQLFNLGVSFRTKYGHLLKPGQKPVFRTESQDRMLKSALNFAAGFFGVPYEEQYHQLITVEWPGFNNTLAPYMTCKNANRMDLTRGPQKMAEWIKIYLADALERMQAQVEGVKLTHRDVFNMQLLCAYELVALGGSAFCPLFTEDEWRGFEYAHDIEFFDIFSFGQSAQAAVGKGWVQEWLARTLNQPLSEFNSTTNSTLHTSRYFPLDQNIYVDATHDTIVSAVIVSLGFSSFARSAPLPTDHIPHDLSFVTSSISPFAANLHSQVLSCPDSPLAKPGRSRFVRWILNDGVVPLDSIDGCVANEEGMCELDAFVRATQRRLEEIDWAYDCLGHYKLPREPIRDGRPPHS
ncbi:histidine phosphatase superfamily [Rhodotorula toruloides]